jgi:hypothetical protein
MSAIQGILYAQLVLDGFHVKHEIHKGLFNVMITAVTLDSAEQCTDFGAITSGRSRQFGSIAKGPVRLVAVLSTMLLVKAP